MADRGRDSFAFVTLTYNHGLYIIEHLESIKYQIEKYGAAYDVSLIVADDHSRDNTVGLARRWIAKNSCLFAQTRILENDSNKGTCANYVRVLEAIETRWFKVLAGDDVYAVSDVFSLSTAVEPALFVSGIPLMLEEKALRFSRTVVLNMVATAEIYRKGFGDAMRCFSSIHTPSLAYDRGLVDDEELKDFIKGYNVVEDFAMQIKSWELHPEMRYTLVPDVYVYYRRTANSTYIIKNDKFLDDKRRLFEYLASRESSIIRKALLHNRVFCLDLRSRTLKLLCNLNAYVYACRLAMNSLKILKKYRLVKIDMRAHQAHYDKLRDAAARFLDEVGEEGSFALDYGK